MTELGYYYYIGAVGRGRKKGETGANFKLGRVWYTTTLIRTRKSPWILRIYIDVVVFRGSSGASSFETSLSFYD